jgi:hypothetical protein
MSKDVDERIVETVKATGAEVVAKPLNVKKYPKKSEASEEDKEKAVRESTIGEWSKESTESVRDNNVSEGSGDDRDDSSE